MTALHIFIYYFILIVFTPFLNHLFYYKDPHSKNKPIQDSVFSATNLKTGSTSTNVIDYVYNVALQCAVRSGNLTSNVQLVIDALEMKNVLLCIRKESVNKYKSAFFAIVQ